MYIQMYMYVTGQPCTIVKPEAGCMPFRLNTMKQQTIYPQIRYAITSVSMCSIALHTTCISVQQ